MTADKKFEKYAKKLEKRIVQTIVDTRRMAAGREPETPETPGWGAVALTVAGLAAAVALTLWLPDHDNAND